MKKQINYSLEKAEPVIDKMKKVYYVQSSEVASLIGKNPYVPVEQAMLRFMKRVNYRQFKNIVKIINANEVGLVTDALLKTNKTVRILFYKAINVTDNTDLKKYFELIYDAIEDTTYYKTMKESVQKEVKSRINKKRGNKFEDKGINQYENKTKRTVTDRNSEMFEKIIKREDEYTVVLRAKIDGIDRDNDCLIEHKNRVNELFEKIPSYEKVQLEIYMHITKLGSCKLVQTHFEDTSEMEYNPSIKRWKRIKFGIIDSVRTIHELMKEPEKMKRFVSKYRKYL